MSNSVAWFDNITTSLKANFCPVCSGLLDPPNSTGLLTCKVCQHRLSVEELDVKVIETKSKMKHDANKSKSALKKVTGDIAAKMSDGSVVCQKCENKELYFKTAQLRSADEGQTVFYECTRCGFTWSLNT